jgi:hypothetical protein
MSGRKYPLDPLAKLRHRQVDAATQDLAKAIDARREAERKREAAEAERARADAEARAVRAEELAALEKGALRAGDLLRAQVWEVGVEAERKRMTQQVESAGKAEEVARRTEAGAQGALAAREADAEIVEKDKSRFVAREAQRELTKEEEAAAEAHEANRRERWRPER